MWWKLVPLFPECTQVIFKDLSSTERKWSSKKGKSVLENNSLNWGINKTNISLIGNLSWVWDQCDVPDLQFYPKPLYFLNFAANLRITYGPIPDPLDQNLYETNLRCSKINRYPWVILLGSSGNMAIASVWNSTIWAEDLKHSFAQKNLILQ